MSFEQLNVKKEISQALTGLGIVTPTLIQVKAIPLIKEGKDVIGISKTGSGKTVAFGVPMLEKITPAKHLQGIILAPTRELAVQIAQELRKFGRHLNHSIATVYGGVSLEPQIRQIAQAQILVGTPGRVLDHLRRGTLDLSHISMAVLDEADKMVEMGFIEDVKTILDQTPKHKQMLLFGATVSDEIGKIRQAHMNSPVIAQAEKQVQEDLLSQYYCQVEQREKFSLLVHLLKKEKIDRAIIFCSARSTVELVAHNLRAQNIRVSMIHGKLNQSKRLRLIESFNNGSHSILVASAVAARGLDIKDITHIFNYDLSPDPQEYIHRIGRTARAGESGKAITLLSPRDYEAFSNILNRYRVKVQELPRERFERVQFDARRARPNYSFGQRRTPFHRSEPQRSFPRRDGMRPMHSNYNLAPGRLAARQMR